jgi:alginate O-acetyltransferase complex protein AlgI
MLFSSIPFLILFLPGVLLVYYYCPVLRWRNYILLFSSLLFYAWGEPLSIFIMIISILFNYRMGLVIASSGGGGGVNKRLILGLSIGVNLLCLFYFKYLGLAAKIINVFLGVFNISVTAPGIILPIGISFYTFQSISYLVDVYKKPSLLQKNLCDLGLYIAFFPQLIAGPIVRYHDINEQIKYREFNADTFAAGIQRFVIGLAKKVLLANVLAEVADSIFALEYSHVPSFYLGIAILAYTLQLYYDFSGYSDMAIGLGKMFGFSLLENFNYPYISKSISEFWRRWHISLSSWFKDYLYIPLGGNRKGKMRTVMNLFVVFFATGLWHGAELHFVFWGMGHGVLLFIEKIFGARINKMINDGIIKTILSHIYTLFCITFLWLFFRVGIKEAFTLIKCLFSSRITDSEIFPLFVNSQFYLCFAVGIVLAFPWWRYLTRGINQGKAMYVFKHITLLILLTLSICALASNAYNPFIYFRF